MTVTKPGTWSNSARSGFILEPDVNPGKREPSLSFGRQLVPGLPPGSGCDANG